MAQFQQSNGILKTQYWDKFLGDSMYSQSVANAMLTKSISTNVSTASKALQDGLNKFFGAGLQVDGIVGTKTLMALNTYTAMVNPNSSQNEQNIITHISVYNAPIKPSTSTTPKTPPTNTTNVATTSPPISTTPPTKPPINWGKWILYGALALGGSALLYMATKKSNSKQALQGVKISKKKSTKKRQKK